MTPQILVPDRIISIPNLLSPDECERLIADAEARGFEAATVATKSGSQMRTDVRNNSRVNWEDATFAAAMWPRIQPFVPSPLFGREAVRLNERWRFYRYEPGEVFKRHQDGSVRLENGEKSQMTLLFYLNEGCVGGQTRFYLTGRDEPLEVNPSTGAALLFLHSFQHEGAPVEDGVKYVLRSDVFYGAS